MLVLSTATNPGIASFRPSSNLGSGALLWQPGGPGPIQTWADVMAIVDSTDIPLAIYGDQSFAPLIIPSSSGTSNLKFSWLAAKTLGQPGFIQFNLQDGAVLHDLYGVVGAAGLVCSPTTGPCLTFTPPGGGQPALLANQYDGAFQNNGSVPAVEVPDGLFFVLGGFLSGGVATGTAPFARAGVGSTILLASIAGGIFQSDIVSSVDGTATLIWRLDGTGPSPVPSQAGFTGTTLVTAIGPAMATTTALRPVGSQPGQTDFDTDLGIPIWWNGIAWVDSTGAPV